MKVFISHHSSDSTTAKKIADRLHTHAVSSYLDVVDPYIGKNGEDLASHIRAQMSTCDHLIAVISFGTKASQWVPWEIGVATDRDYPLAAYSDMISPMPEFLAAWPKLSSMEDVDAYVSASRAGDRIRLARRGMGAEFASARSAGTKAFYTELRRSLGR